MERICYITITVISMINLCSSYLFSCGDDVNNCFNKTMECPSNEDCVVECRGNFLSCSYSTIICPSSSAKKTCTVKCDGDNTCSQIIIDAADSSGSLNILSSGSDTLSRSSIYCPSKSCDIAYNGTSNGLNDITIYSPSDDFNDNVNIQCSSLSNCWSADHQPVVFYGDEYNEQCEIDVISFNHDDNNGDNEIICMNEEHDVAEAVEEEQSTSTTTTTSILIVEGREEQNTSDNSSESYGFDHELLLVILGMICGILLTVVCCLLLILHFKCREESKSNRGHETANSPSSLRRISPKLSPVLYALSKQNNLVNNDALKDQINNHWNIRKILDSPSLNHTITDFDNVGEADLNLVIDINEDIKNEVYIPPISPKSIGDDNKFEYSSEEKQCQLIVSSNQSTKRGDFANPNLGNDEFIIESDEDDNFVTDYNNPHLNDDEFIVESDGEYNNPDVPSS